MNHQKLEIKKHCDAMNALQQQIHTTVKRRHCSEACRKKWDEACHDFHSYIVCAEVNRLLREVCCQNLEADQSLRAFVFDYIHVDPIYFRSGYIKEKLFQKVKKLDLTETEKSVLRKVILRRIRCGAYREYKRLCRLIPKIETYEFKQIVLNLSMSAHGSIQRRALFTLQYFKLSESLK